MTLDTELLDLIQSRKQSLTKYYKRILTMIRKYGAKDAVLSPWQNSHSWIRFFVCGLGACMMF